MDLISQHSGKSFGGVCTLEVYDLQNGSPTMPDTFDQKVASAITLPAGDWEEIKFIRFTAQPVESSERRSGSIYYRFRLSFVVAKDTGERMATLYQASRKQFLVKFTDHNGVTKLIGSPSEPASLNIQTRDNQAQYFSRNEIQMEITYQGRQPFAEYPF